MTTSSSSRASSRINRRTFIQGVTATALGGSILAACGPASSSNVTITHWDWFVSQAPWIDNEIKLFHAAHPNITIRKSTQAVDKYPDLFALAVKGKNEPDVFMIPAQPPIADQISKKWLRPIDDIVPSSFKSRFPEGSFREGNNIFGGKLYSAPFSGGAPWAQLYLDNQNFKMAGLTDADGNAKLPQKWDDIINFADTIQKKSNGSVTGLYLGTKEGNELSWALHMFSLATGAPGGAWGVDYRTGKYTYASDRVYQDVLEFFLELKKRNLVNPDSMTVGDELARVNFTQHKGGMIFGGTWNQSGWATAGYTDYAMTTLIPPSGTPKAYFYVNPGGTFLAVSSQTKHAQEAGLWIDWIYSKEAGKRWVEMGEDLSVFPENNSPSVVSKNKTFAQYVKESKLAIAGPDPSIRNPQTGQVKFPSVSPGINDIVTGVWTGQITDIHAALSDLQDRANAAQAQGLKDAQASGLKVSENDYIFSDWDPTQAYITKPQS